MMNTLIVNRPKSRPSETNVVRVGTENSTLELTEPRMREANTHDRLRKILTHENVRLENLQAASRWNPQARVPLWLLLMQAPSHESIRFGGANDNWSRSLFEAFLADIPSPDDHDRYDLWKRSCLEIIAVSPSNRREQLLASLHDRLKKADNGGPTLRRLRQEVETIRGQIQRAIDAGRGPIEVRKAIDFLDSDMPPGLLVPSNYQLSNAGVSIRQAKREGTKLRSICKAPLILCERSIDAHSGEEYVTIAWYRRGSWVRVTVPRRVITDRKEILQLANRGAPINSNNAGEGIDYLAEFEALNIDLLDYYETSSQLGWQGANGSRGFLHGCKFIPSPVKAGKSVPAMRFQPPDAGMRSLVDGFCVKGDLVTWQAAMEPVMHFPVVALALYGSLTAPLLEILRIPNFGIDLSGVSSTGKTSALKLAASIWGDPNSGSERSIIRRSDGSPTFLERVAIVSRDLPLFLDETKLSSDEQAKAQLIYSFSTGLSRGRGTTAGVQEQTAFRSIFFTTGEKPITESTRDGGTKPRVLTLWSKPFGGNSRETARLINEVSRVIESNYGLLGRKWIRELVARRKDRALWRARFDELKRSYERQVGDDPFALRQADAWAAISLASELVHEFIELPWEHRDPIGPLLVELRKEVQAADVHREALFAAYEFYTGHVERFFHAKLNDRSPRDWAGCCRFKKSDDSPLEANTEYPLAGLAFLPGILDTHLQSRGFDSAAARRAWRDRGWIVANEQEQRMTVKRRIGSNRAHVIALTPAAIQIVQG